MTVNIEIKLADPALMPEKAHYNDAAYDIRANIKSSIYLPPGLRLLVPTGIQLGLPDGYEAIITPRSGLAVNFGITVLNTPGTIDAGYRGEIKVILHNSSKTETFTVNPRDRIAQMKIKKVLPTNLIPVNELNETIRGTGGFGSSGTASIPTKTMGLARFITELVVLDPDSKADVGVAIFKDENSGALFGIDSSFLTEMEEPITIEPFNHTKVKLIGI